MEQMNEKEPLLCQADELEDLDDYDDVDDEDDLEVEEVVISFTCEDCDYRWEAVMADDDESIEEVQYCPMCGSSNTTQI